MKAAGEPEVLLRLIGETEVLDEAEEDRFDCEGEVAELRPEVTIGVAVDEGCLFFNSLRGALRTELAREPLEGPVPRFASFAVLLPPGAPEAEPAVVFTDSVVVKGVHMPEPEASAAPEP